MAPGCPDHAGKELLHAIQVTAVYRDCYYSDGTISQTSTLKPIPAEGNVDQVVFAVIMVIFVLGLFWGFKWAEPRSIYRGSE